MKNEAVFLKLSAVFRELQFAQGQLPLPRTKNDEEAEDFIHGAIDAVINAAASATGLTDREILKRFIALDKEWIEKQNEESEL